MQICEIKSPTTTCLKKFIKREPLFYSRTKTIQEKMFIFAKSKTG